VKLELSSEGRYALRTLIYLALVGEQATADSISAEAHIPRRLLAWSIWALSIVLVGLGLVFQILNLSEPSLPIYAHWAESMLLGVGFPTVGAIIASRRTHNPIGW
jgi:hypothetical protein